MFNNRHIIGVVGGMGSYATSYFFQKLLDDFPVEKEWERPRIILDNNCVMPSRVRAILYDEKINELVDSLSSSVNGLVSLGCDKIILACITSHYFLKQLKISEPDSFEIIDLLKATVSAIKNKREVYVFCTEGTAQTRLWDEYFDSEIRIIYPEEDALKQLRVFIEAVKQNLITDDVVDDFAKFIISAPSQSVILGCTELPVLYSRCKAQLYNSGKTIYDPLQCGINNLKRRILL